MNEIDWKALALQEPEFVDFVKIVFWESTLATQTDFLKAIYSFYQIGMTAEQVAQWMTLNNRMGLS
jgi:hypothetical protein